MVHPDISELQLGKIEDERQREREISEKSIVKKVPDQEDVGSGSDSEDDAGDAVYTEPTSKTRQTLLNERFKALITKKREMITEEDIRDAIKRTDNEDLSMSNIIAKQDSTSIIHDPREYQLELFEKAKNNNIIAVLDTGSGKTLIAILLIKHIIKEELENRRARKPHRISFFLVDSVALVYQQAAVLNANIDQPINKFCGAMETDLWSKETWENHFKKNMIIVCTAEVLQQCLLHSYIKMDQINLLIFDEAHHAKKGHPYARILKDFYFQPGLTSRPKLFGMTASPVDAKVGVFKAASALESILDSRILTTSNPDLLRQTIAHPLEETWVYSKLGIPFETDLYKKLYSLIGDISVVQKLFRSAIHLSTILGSWCTDLVLSRNLGDEVLPKLEGQAAKEKATDEEIKRIRAANEIVRKKKVPDLSANLENLSPKTRLLVEKLSSYFKRPTDSKCIVFVEERHTAMVLNELFSRVRTPYLYPGFLVGVRSQDFVDAGISHRKQVLTLMRFRKGEINCLFATSVAEEGLDIPDCNVVIRFDLYSTVIQYVQSRGRARHSNSVFVNMVEQGNLRHEQALEWVKCSEDVMRRFCSSLPADRCLDKYMNSFEDLTVQRIGRKSYRIEKTGALLTYNSSLTVLAHFANSLQYDKDIVNPQVSYYFTREENAFVCEAVLPEKSFIRGCRGQPSSQKMVAKQSAAFEACLILRKNGLLDEHFVSTYKRRLPLMRSAKLAITSKNTNQYSMLTKPKAWEELRGNLPTFLYANVFSFKPMKTLIHTYHPLVLLTRQPMRDVPNTPLYLEDDIECDVLCTSIEEPIDISSVDLDLLSTFTFSVFRHLFHKIYEKEPEKLSYWIAPASIQYNEAKSSREVLDWTLIQTVGKTPHIQWFPGMSPSTFENRFIFDPWDGKHRYFTSKVEPTLKPSDPPIPGMAKRKHMGSILEYSLSMYGNTRKKHLESCNWLQPVVKAELLHLRRNLLDKATEKEKEHSEPYYICLESLSISNIPPPVASSLYTFPSIITRVEGYMIAAEACNRYSLTISPDLALEALTKDSDSIDENKIDQIHLQRGMGKNYERLELLGDCFLKMATTISLFAMNPNNDEFDFHVKRMILICNKNLLNTATKTGLHEFIRTKGFSRRCWYPEGLSLRQGKVRLPERTHRLGDKTIADICEAMIGAAFLSKGAEHRFDSAVRAVTAFVSNADHNVQKWSDYRGLYSIPNYQVASADASELDLAAQIEEKLGYRFKYPKLLRSAFTHPSYPSAWAKGPCYQRLEFLGDSLLDMACVEYLFQRYPDKDPQWLTEHKMAMVSNKFLGAVAVNLGFHKHMLYYSNPLMRQIAIYVEEIEAAEAESPDSPDAWVSTGDPPKSLPDTVESYIAAVFVDSDFKYEVVEDFFKKFIERYFEDMTIYDTFANKHPTTYLHHRLSVDLGCKNYCLKAGEIPYIDGTTPRILAALIIHDDVVAEGIASSARYARVKASGNALIQLEGLPAFRFREKYGCDCKPDDHE